MSNLSVIYLLEQLRRLRFRYRRFREVNKSDLVPPLCLIILHNSLELKGSDYETITCCVITRKATQIIFDLHHKSTRLVKKFSRSLEFTTFTASSIRTIFRLVELSSDFLLIYVFFYFVFFQPNVPADEIPRIRFRQ